MADRDLGAGQAAIAAALIQGPDHCPADLFVDGDVAILRGLAVHANTVSHARLVALEDSFPRCRAHLGEALFNRLSRSFLDAGGAMRRSLNKIGADFPEWLGLASGRLAADIAMVEWAWLESYHAMDAPALLLSDLAGLAVDDLLALRTRRHPAARIVTLSSAAAPHFDPALSGDTPALLLTRPEADVRLLAVSEKEAAFLAGADSFAPLGNLIARFAEPGGDAAAVLIGAGAMEKSWS
ncbi:MAG: DNA-binding domain-containing protein [Sphingopyxis sp.]|uniref:DNA-binding domain-containing protein n=1 Tax=Sphingopyxis sp. TaxID=1908224 RepID=UPI002ABBE9FD|nr:DNA-binding domain-containing protein [Sphingopyxis sp.]MDZ3833573.1 DNA-binding domain-containing protein [Sphingopyxis sp.]